MTKSKKEKSLTTAFGNYNEECSAKTHKDDLTLTVWQTKRNPEQNSKQDQNVNYRRKQGG